MSTPNGSPYEEVKTSIRKGLIDEGAAENVNRAGATEIISGGGPATVKRDELKAYVMGLESKRATEQVVNFAEVDDSFDVEIIADIIKIRCALGESADAKEEFLPFLN